MTENTPPDVNIEQIMQEIRQQILAERAEQSGSAVVTPPAGDRLPPEFYEHLYQAELAYNQLGVKLQVTPVNVPLVGRLLEWLRGKLHELVLFYVNQLAAQQIKVNTHLLQAVSILAAEFDAPDSDEAG